MDNDPKPGPRQNNILSTSPKRAVQSMGSDSTDGVLNTPGIEWDWPEKKNCVWVTIISNYILNHFTVLARPCSITITSNNDPTKYIRKCSFYTLVQINWNKEFCFNRKFYYLCSKTIMKHV